MLNKSYQELRRIPTFEERFEYLMMGGAVGRATFGFDRYLNQVLYQSREWKLTRRDIILRDCSCDLGISGRNISRGLVLHHINPITIDDILHREECVLDPNNLICTSQNTHTAIHFGDASTLVRLPPTRRKGDTDLW